MEQDYNRFTALFKALSDDNRLKIIDMLSCGEICACKILDGLEISQSTLSHHMKALEVCALVSSRREGKWTYYTLNGETVKAVLDFIKRLALAQKGMDLLPAGAGGIVKTITSPQEGCICEGV
jgi:ArsR family transcriptional regulator